MSTTIELTEKAKKQLAHLNVTRDNFLRLWVEAGGCSGMSYQAAIDSSSTPFDTVLYEDDDIKVVSDAQSAKQMEGMTVDYSDDLVKAGFRFENPNASATCGCGSSFKI